LSHLIGNCLPLLTAEQVYSGLSYRLQRGVWYRGRGDNRRGQPVKQMAALRTHMSSINTVGPISGGPRGTLLDWILILMLYRQVQCNGTSDEAVMPACPVVNRGCGFWDEASRRWRKEGCRHVNTTSNGTVICECNHLTDFTTLDVSGRPHNKLPDKQYSTSVLPAVLRSTGSTRKCTIHSFQL
jgi:hypothetical protein